MLWRARGILQCSHSWRTTLQRCAQPATSSPLAVSSYSRFFVSTSQQRGCSVSRSLCLPKDADPSPENPGADPAEHSSERSIPSLSHFQLLVEDHQSSGATDHEIRLAGLVQSTRKQKKAAFAHISDGTTLKPFQAVLSPEQAVGITNGSYVSLIGVWKKSIGKEQDHELQVQRVESIGPADPEQYPIQKKYHTQEYLRTIPHLRLRAPFHSLMARARHTLMDGLSCQLASAGVIQVHPPLITSSDCEGAGEVFTISPYSALPSTEDKKELQQYFREPKYLTVSSQLHLEAYSAELSDVFALAPTFRAEESDTPRHLSEFYMLEAEHRGIHTLEALMRKVEGCIQGAVAAFRASSPGKELLQYYADHQHSGVDDQIDLDNRWRRLSPYPSEVHSYRYKRCTHQEAVKRLLQADAEANGFLFKTKPSYTLGLQLEHERWTVDNIGEGRPVFVTHYPKAAKPFYVLPSHPSLSDKGIETVACFDLLLPFGYCEVAGGSLREHRLENLIANMRERGMLKRRDPTKPAKDSQYPFLQPDEDLGNLRWYADLRRFGSSPHGGYGLGFDRLLAYLTGVSNVRDVVAFPRTWGRADC